MSATVLDGKTLARKIEQELVERVNRFAERSGGHAPRLATILVGDDPASATYVRMKATACQRIGMESQQELLGVTTTTAELLARIDVLNADPQVHGILLQHPVPSHIDERLCFDRIALGKDVDGVTSHGFGLMAMGEDAYGSATPAGIMRLLDHYGIEVEGKRAVVVGRSPILGKPLAAMLTNANATVTLCHSRTRDLPSVIREAEVVVGALGRPEYIKGAWIRNGAVVIDAGYHPGKIGDIELAAAAKRASAYTPVPGGVGPMTIATLVAQTVEAAESALSRS